MTTPSKKSVDDDERCGCDEDFGAADLAEDEALPASSGGVALQDAGDDADGCDLFFGDMTTEDEELPASTGGVE